MELYLEDGKQLSPKSSTLILPALSIGNVGQLAVDLLISSLKAEKVACLDDPNVLPCVGNDAYSASPLGKLALSLEAYEASFSELTLVQQRSPVVKGMMMAYAKNIANFAAANGKKHIVLLSSLDFGRWRNIDMSSGLQIYYLSSSNLDGTDAECESLGWKKLQDYNPALRMWKYLDTLAQEVSVPDEDSPFEELGDEDYYPSLPFAALFSCFKAKGLKVTCLFCYCSEGDNIPEAFSMAEAAGKLVGLNDFLDKDNGAGKWITPFSWQSVYGPPADMTLF
ncbi:proteasome assembly chaperone 2-like isoform X1 [Salvia splendens]|uniref:proteasome assembly chaperone 2-like isoform X1 n=1 Tax=Salvia splendens TaxID=180675 RepID=UPI001C2591E3|nr:proteasome assembly chaperone 2-like isoform X1 [Salvia splendens]